MSKNDTVIRCAGLGKRYRRGERVSYQRLTETLAAIPRLPLRMARSICSKKSPPDNDSRWFWALRDVNFEVKQGEVLGIIGRNGAGKSTLLKIFSRITDPTNGCVDITGRVGSLLEVGTGFHPELTGRENIFLNGAILGMTKTEIRAKFDEIIAFAEIETFLDTPVKRYSSGMQTRLGFAVAAHLEPEILIVDEVLAVGDLEFQKKCLGKMNDVAASGRTVLFVSHNLSAIEQLTERCLVLDAGQCRFIGDTRLAISRYLGDMSPQAGVWNWKHNADEVSNQSSVVLLQTRIVNCHGESATAVPSDEPFDLRIEYDVREAGMILSIRISVFGDSGAMLIYSVDNIDPDVADQTRPMGTATTIITFPANLFNDGILTINLDIKQTQNRVKHVAESGVARVEILDTPALRGSYSGRWPGAIRPKLQWRCETSHEPQS